VSLPAGTFISACDSFIGRSAKQAESSKKIESDAKAVIAPNWYVRGLSFRIGNCDIEWREMAQVMQVNCDPAVISEQVRILG
jgi:hypothetical protein